MFAKVRAGWYATADGRWAVLSDGDSDGWVACFDRHGGLRVSHQNGENLGWFSTRDEAMAQCDHLARWV